MTLRRVCFVAAVVTMFVPAVVAEGAELCPSPLHLVRRVSDSIGGRAVTIDEYCDGNRIISISGANVTVADYSRAEFLEIRRDEATWSLSTFAEVAAASARRATAQANAAPWTLRAIAVKPEASPRASEAYAAERATAVARVSIEISVDRQIRLSREGLEALIGSSYPNRRSDLHDALIDASGPSKGSRAAAMATDSYALPVDEVVTVETERERLVSRMSVLAVDSSRVAPELLVIPPGSTRVESHLTRFARELDLLDAPAPR